MALAWVKQQTAVTFVLGRHAQPRGIELECPVTDITLSADVMQRLADVTEPVKAKLGNNPDMWMTPSRMR